jgi:hypothetical protein
MKQFSSWQEYFLETNRRSIMQADAQKVKPEHLKRDAYLYIRQSTPRQVLENTESTNRQYALQKRAIALGWPSERIVVIDKDLRAIGRFRGRS